MSKPIDSERIRRTLLAKEREGQRVNLYISKEVYADFKRHCEPLAASAVVEELMREYMATSKGPMKAKYSKGRK